MTLREALGLGVGVLLTIAGVVIAVAMLPLLAIDHVVAHRRRRQSILGAIHDEDDRLR